MLLPKVNENLLHSSLKSFSEDNKGLSKKWYTKIKEENPTLWLLIEAVLDSDESIDFQNGYTKAALQFYYLLNAQLECDELNKGF